MTTPSHDDAPPDRAAAPTKKPKVVRWLLIAAVAFGALAAMGIIDRRDSEADLTKWTDRRAVTDVDLVSPHRATADENLTLPANVDAFYTAPIHSRVNGYVKMWYFDIGAHVKAGQVLARIDTPDLDQQYAQVKGELLKAQANYNLAVVTADRWKALRASNAVSQQTVDEKAGDAAAQKAQVVAAQANVDRIKAMQDFRNILAPFDGVVTARNIDVGALVSATNTSAHALFDVADIKQVRVYVRVPQVYAASMRKGLKVTLTLPQYPRKTFEGTIDTTSDAISDTSRALLVEAIFENSDGLLSPGAYAQARFQLPLDPEKLVIPSSAMIFRDLAPEVAVVKDGKVILKKVTILVDTGPEIEIANGLEHRRQVRPQSVLRDGDRRRGRRRQDRRQAGQGRPVVAATRLRRTHEAATLRLGRYGRARAVGAAARRMRSRAALSCAEGRAAGDLQGGRQVQGRRAVATISARAAPGGASSTIATLDALEPQVDDENQTLAAAFANYEIARTTVQAGRGGAVSDPDPDRRSSVGQQAVGAAHLPLA